MIPFKRPMLAVSLMPSGVEHTDENILKEMRKLRYPVMATLKLDGIRALRLNGSLLSRTLKPIPNDLIRQKSLVLPGGMDMELCVGDKEYHDVESVVMSKVHPDSDKIEFYILDWFGPESYAERMHKIAQLFTKKLFASGVRLPKPVLIADAEELLRYFKCIERWGGEGICFRTPNSPYKQGRSTLREQYLVKLCRFVTEEVTIVGFEEQMCNTNRLKRNAVGAVDRSSAGHRLVGKNTLGALRCKRGDGSEVLVGTGMDDRMRAKVWHHQPYYINKQCTIKYKSHGIKTLPRSPVFVGMRMKGF